MKKYIIIIILLLSLIFTATVQALDSSEVISYIGKHVNFGIIIQFQTKDKLIKVRNALVLNVITGINLYDNYFSGYYIVFKTYSKTKKTYSETLLLPVKQMTYIRELK